MIQDPHGYLLIAAWSLLMIGIGGLLARAYLWSMARDAKKQGASKFGPKTQSAIEEMEDWEKERLPPSFHDCEFNSYDRHGVILKSSAKSEVPHILRPQADIFRGENL